MTSEKCPHCKHRALFVGEYCAQCRRHRVTGDPGNADEIQALLEKVMLEAREGIQERAKKPKIKISNDPAIQEWLEALLQKPTSIEEPLMTPQLCPHCGQKAYFAEEYCCRCRRDRATGLLGNPKRTQALIEKTIAKLRQGMARRMASVAKEEKRKEAEARWRRWSAPYEGL